MIRVVRSSAPTVLTRNAARRLAAVEAATSPHALKRALSRYNDKGVRVALERMFHGKCAYCESKIAHVSYPHIEHYRPKTKFWDLAFDWDNFLLACGVCNSPEYKGQNFPESEEGGPLVNPCADEPAEHFEFLYDPITQIASVVPITTRGETTERVMGLNRTDLIAHRSKYVRRLACLATYVSSDLEAQALLDEAVSDAGEFAAFVRDLCAS